MKKEITLGSPKMKKKLKLSFEQLEKEMELLPSNMLHELNGGHSGILLNDCMIEAVSFAIHEPYNDVLDDFADWATTQPGWSSYSIENELQVIEQGMDGVTAANFAMFMGLANVGDVPLGPDGYAVDGDQSVAFVDYGGGNGHAIVLLGNENNFEYHYYDPQENRTGTIRKNSESLVETYGYW